MIEIRLSGLICVVAAPLVALTVPGWWGVAATVGLLLAAGAFASRATPKGEGDGT